MKRLVRLTLLAAVCLSLVGCTNALRWRHYDYVVQRGDTLYSIAWHFDLDYRDLAAWNGINPPYRIYPGEKLVLSRAKAGYAASSTVSTPSSTTVARNPAPTRTPAPAPDEYAGKTVSDWLWPAEGRIVSHFDPDKITAKGINIGGQFGEPVRAAADGRVVYSGSGLVGYGELIIIKHNNHYLSAYAHNRKRLVQEGDEVKAGDEIATMGHGNNGEALLHFEIRYDGKPVDPLHYLPSRS
ncbi:MAG TPA: peptidoglycan DD-metalloendopeptidase family protein [Gammaproteobacteria bacterium]|jgi:lipoprotein NlpD|nr:peptidoglycan DD-metalloendopeptidase family protein [Gammaproteobacteria bacterium]HET7586879.1 peptidoglycan DD-metalloendopeptidase family protein [Gammaproteobacteria bacterium]